MKRFRFGLFACLFGTAIGQSSLKPSESDALKLSDLKADSTTTQNPKKPIIVALIKSPPFVIVNKPNATKDVYQDELFAEPGSLDDIFGGFCVDLLRRLVKEAELGPIRLRLVRDRAFGAKRASGWTGAVGEVVRGEADLALGPLTVTPARAQVCPSHCSRQVTIPAIHFSPPFHSTDLAVLLKKAPPARPSVFHFLQVFNTRSWRFLLATVAATTLVLWLVSRLSPGECATSELLSGEAHDDSPNTFGSLPNCLWYVLGSGIFRGTGLAPRSLAARIVAISWFGFASTWLLLLGAQLVRWQSLRITPEAELEDFESIVRQAKYDKTMDVGFMAAGATEKYFQNAEKGLLAHRLWEHVKSTYPDALVPTYKAGMERVRKSNGSYAFVMEASAAADAVQTPPCDLRSVDAHQLRRSFALATRRGSGLGRELDSRLLDLLDRGVVANLRDKWLNGRGRCRRQAKLDEALSADSAGRTLQGFLCLAAAGLCLALFAGAVELFIVSLSQARRRKQTLGRVLGEHFGRCFKGQQRNQCD